MANIFTIRFVNYVFAFTGLPALPTLLRNPGLGDGS
jgi:hypothetical protein